MKTKLLRLLAWSLALVLIMGLAVTASAADIAHVVVIQWEDENNAEKIRPDQVTCTMNGEDVLVEKNGGWAGIAVGPNDATWSISAVSGYTPNIGNEKNGITIIKMFHDVKKKDIVVSAKWNDTFDGKENANGVRPSDVLVQLLADNKSYGPPQKLSSSNGWTATWDDVLENMNGAALSYTVQTVDNPEFYPDPVIEYSGDNVTVTYTLKTGTLQVNTALTNAPVLNPGLNLRIEGPDRRTADPSNPLIVSYRASYTLADVLPGAYLVTVINPDAYEDSGAYVVPAETTRADAVYVNGGATGTTNLRVTWTDTIPDRERNENPLAAENTNQLLFEIIGPDETLPITLTYAQFQHLVSSPELASGEYYLGNLKPGSYAVVERNEGTLIDNYRLRSDSITGVTFQVTANNTATGAMTNIYEPSLTPPPQPDLVNIPVTKIWDDNDNAEGSRPESITVRLYADGAEVESRQLTAANNWSITFMDLPRYRIKDVEYVYSVQEDPVPLYLTSVNGTTITNTYQSVLTRTSVRKLWNDNNNAAGLRPASVTMTLRNGASVVTTVRLSDENGWYAEVTDLPSRVNGAPAVYTWTEQEVIGYVSTMSTDGTSVVFTNTPWERPPEPRRTPRVPGRPVFVFEEYETPLGIAVEINHVGDCFD